MKNAHWTVKTFDERSWNNVQPNLPETTKPQLETYWRMKQRNIYGFVFCTGVAEI